MDEEDNDDGIDFDALVAEIEEEEDYMDDEEDYYDDDDDYDDDEFGDTQYADSESYEQDRLRAINVIRSATDRTCTTWFTADTSRIAFRIDYACHADLLQHIPPEPTIFASCFNTKTDLNAMRAPMSPNEDEATDLASCQVEAEAYWDFIAGPTSPWKMLFQHSLPEKILSEEGEIVGFFLDTKNLKGDSHGLRKLLYNFCIAMRMVGEERSTIRMFYRLKTEHEMENVDAMFLARMISSVKNFNGEEIEDERGSCSLAGLNDSCHWPIGFSTWCEKGNFSFKKFREGTPDFSRSNEVAFWFDLLEYENFNIPAAITAGGFPSERDGPYGNYKFKIADVITCFYDWQRKNGQKPEQEMEKAA